MSDVGGHQALATVADGTWSVRSRGRQIVFVNGTSTLEVPVEGTLRWSWDGEELSFDGALQAVPPELHGWLRLAALVALRHCIGGLMLAVALPPGHHEWDLLADRAAHVEAWMRGLSRLDNVAVPRSPDGVDDGVSDLEDPEEQ